MNFFKLKKSIKKYLNYRYQFEDLRSWLFVGLNRIVRFLGISRLFSEVYVKLRLKDKHSHFVARIGTTDFQVLQEIYMLQEYAMVVQNAHPPLKLILDLGANVGYSIRYWCENFPESVIIGVEPNLGNFQTCNLNIAALISTAKITLLNACVGGTSRLVKLTTDSGEWAFAMAETTPNDTNTIKALTIPQILEKFPSNQTIDLIKCDIEGAEKELFKDCSSWIKRVQNLVVELHPPYNKNEFLADLNKSNADLVVVSEEKDSEFPVIFLKRAINSNL